MPITVRGKEYDTMGEACERLGISRSSMLRYIKEKFFTKPPEVSQGRGKKVRYFTEDWYLLNAAKLNASRKQS